MAENATHNLHNLLTLRGALVRDPRVWARHLTEAIAMFGDRTDVAFAGSTPPSVGGGFESVPFVQCASRGRR